MLACEWLVTKTGRGRRLAGSIRVSCFLQVAFKVKGMNPEDILDKLEDLEAGDQQILRDLEEEASKLEDSSLTVEGSDSTITSGTVSQNQGLTFDELSQYTKTYIGPKAEALLAKMIYSGPTAPSVKRDGNTFKIESKGEYKLFGIDVATSPSVGMFSIQQSNGVVEAYKPSILQEAIDSRMTEFIQKKMADALAGLEAKQIEAVLRPPGEYKAMIDADAEAGQPYANQMRSSADPRPASLEPSPWASESDKSAMRLFQDNLKLLQRSNALLAENFRLKSELAALRSANGVNIMGQVGMDPDLASAGARRFEPYDEDVPEEKA